MWGHQAHSSGSGLSYRRAGKGPAVLLLHGIPGASQSWESVAAAIPATLDVIVPDLLGFGGSDRPTEFEALQATGQAAAIDALLTELAVSRATLVGHDFGGPVALALVRRRASLVGALGLLATNVFPDTPIPFPLSAILWPGVGGLARRALLSGPSLRMMLKQGVGPGVAPPDASTHLGDRDQQQAIAKIFAGSLLHLDEIYRPIEQQLRSIAVPVFVGWGDHDPFFPTAQGERTARAVGAELRLYPGAGHFLPHERSDEIAADILDLVTASTLAS